MNWHVVSLVDVAATPWRNGGGVTRELVAWPPQGDWQWRMSVAEVESSGPFSRFEGVQRWFAVLNGEGVALDIDGERYTLTANSAPLAFDGAAPTDCQLLNGATQDFNLMVRGSGARAAVRSAQVKEEPAKRAGDTEQNASPPTLLAQVNRLFPNATTLATADPDLLGQLGIVKQRQKAIQAIAQAVVHGQLSLHPGADVPTTMAALQALPGIGPWTAHYIALRALRWPDAFPAGDVALHKALSVQDQPHPAQAAEAASQRWRPWRSYAVLRAWSRLNPASA